MVFFFVLVLQKLVIAKYLIINVGIFHLSVYTFLRNLIFEFQTLVKK